MKKTFAYIIISTLIFAAVFFAASLPKSQAQSAALGFGGLITQVTYCTCSGNILLWIGPPSSRSFLFQPGLSVLFIYGQIFRAGPYTVGTYSPGGECLVDDGEDCSSRPVTGGTIRTIGTSI